ncbi:MAG TPA: GNAT family N-acetyltransferase [Thermoleophilia bacterium]|nr:GNAT family N-acetyltransferase [Thermoleophilia bacterium]
MSCTGLIFRRPIPDDWHRVMAVMPGWWGGRDLRSLLPRIFFEHFRGTSLVVEHEDVLVAFLVGFFCPDHADEAYIHFVGVAPEWRRAGLGGDLYRRFFSLARADGRRVVRCVTAPVNSGSVAFHTALGFSILPGDEEVDGLPVLVDHGAHGDHLVRFQLFLEPEAGCLPAEADQRQAEAGG